MRLAKLSEFRSLVYTPDSAPSLNTLRAQIEQIPGGRRMGSRYYVDLDEFDAQTHLRDGILARRAELQRNPLLEGLV